MLITPQNMWKRHAAGGGFTNSRSLKFFNNTNSALSMAAAFRAFTATNNKKFTLSYFWRHDEVTNDAEADFALIDGGTTIGFSIQASNNVDSIGMFMASPDVSGGFLAYGFTPTPSIADFNTWHHLVVSCDTTQATAAAGLKFYVDNTLQTTPAPFVGAWTQNARWNDGSTTQTASVQAVSSGNPIVLLDEVCFVDGQILTPSSFASGGVPIDASGLAFGTGGTYLRFENTANAGAQTSGTWDFSTDAANFVAGDFSTTVPV